MTDAHGAGVWLLALAAALGFLAVTGGIGIRLRFSTIPGYLVGGVILGAVFAIPEPFLHILMTLGSMLILFFVGLEFSPQNLGHRLRVLVAPACWDVAVNMAAALLVALGIGLSPVAAACFGLAAYPSSSAIIARGLSDYRLLALPEAEWCLGLLVIEDLMMALLLPAAVFLLGAGSLALMGGIAMTLVAGLLLLALFVMSVRMGLISRWLDQPAKDLTLLAVLAMLCLIAGIGEYVGISAAVGALFVGMLMSESEGREKIEALLVPHRELLAVGFFTAIGAGTDWRLLLQSLPLAVPLVVITSLAKMATGYLAARGRLSGAQSGIRLGLMLVPRGEFTLVVAALSLAQPWGRSFYNIAVAYVILSALSGALLLRYHAGLSRRLACLLP